MNSKLQKKPFLDYQAQIITLKNKNLSIQDELSASHILSKTSYHGLINGYKDCFKDNTTHQFISGTTFMDIYNLYLFDADLRQVFLKYILIIERHIKSSISYHFSKIHGNGINFYCNFSNYEFGKNKDDVQKLFNKINIKISGKHKSQQVSHYMTIFGEIATMYRYLKGHCKTLVCDDFHHIGRAELGKMLIILTKFRNICAHGNRLFNAHIQDSILDCPAHKKLRISKSGSRYNFGKSDLFSVVICLKYLLDAEDFRLFYYDFKKCIKKHKPTDNTLISMGFPHNWMSILRIKVY